MVNKNKEKESDRLSIDRKRRKSSVISSSSVEASPAKLPKEDVYNSVVMYEEYEAQQRTSAQDSAMFYETCNELRILFTKIMNLKKGPMDSKTLHELQDLRIEGSNLFVILKKLNRLDKVRLRTGRDTLHKEKLKVDSNKLQLQNLLYESHHLRKEVKRCLQFQSQDEKIELISEEDFYKSVPELISRPDKTKTDEHARRLARLEWEFQQRKELSALCKELQICKEKVSNDIEKKSVRLNSLIPKLDNLLKATRPLQEILDMNFENEWKVQNIARLLPRPLYLVYANLNAYAESCDRLLITSIIGDEDEAKQLDESKEENEFETEEISPDSDVEIEEPDTDQPSKEHYHRRQSKISAEEKKRNNLFKPHPLIVTFQVCSAFQKSSLLIKLHYLPLLGFITVTCELVNFPNSGDTAESVVSPDTILNCLSSDDNGEENVNPKIIFQLKELSLDPDKLIEYLNENKLGKPYKWAQKICGFDFITNEPSNQLIQESVPQIIKSIRSRWEIRLKLHKIIHTLGELLVLDKKDVNRFNDTSVQVKSINPCILSRWDAITWKEYVAEPATTKFIDVNIATQYDLFFKGIIIRGSATLSCFINIPRNFPNTIPYWILSLQWNNQCQNAMNNAIIREMEQWINTNDKGTKPMSILSSQLTKALSSFDIYLETEDSITHENHFECDKTYLTAFRGRQRSRPFKMIENSSGVIYKHL